MLSRFTAFVAIDRQVVNPGGTPRGIVQPVEPPAGWAQAEQARIAAPVPVGPMGGGAPRSAPAPARPAAAKSTFSDAAAAAPTDAWAMADDEASFEEAEASVDKLAAPAAAYAPPPPPPPGQAPPAPPRARSSTGGVMQRLLKREARDRKEAAPTSVDARPYHQRLALLADELLAATSHAQPATAAQLPTARLRELVEDARSVGLAALAQAIEPLLERLTAALGAADLVAVLRDVAARLREVATGQAPPPAPTPPARRSFWK